jgi:hypothetical protein
MIPILPDAAVLKRIDEEITVDASKGRVYRNGIEVARGRRCRGRVGIKINGVPRNVYLYHIIWYKVTGRWPHLELHHKNEKKWDDRYSNLEEVTHEVNCLRSKRSSLPAGIDRQGRKYRARLNHRGVLISLGRYKTISQAVAARKSAQENYP